MLRLKFKNYGRMIIVQIITNEEELENVVGGVKTKHVVGATFGILTCVALIAAGKFSYDVYEEYRAKTNPAQDDLGNIKKFMSYSRDVLDDVGLVPKSLYRRLVTEATNCIIKKTSNIN